MTRQEFLHELQLALQGEMSREAVDGHMKYYNDYIMEESRKGGSEEEVVGRLGSPRLIAKTLIDTSGQPSQGGGGQPGWEGDGGHVGNERGFHAGYSPQDGWDVRFGKVKLNSWYGKLLLVVLAVLLLMVIANVVAFLLPFLAPAVLVVLVCSIIFGSRR
ncbi:MAG: DUF1700 domain-containing protein [Lachnospiraceae bacterium]|nr:DUF1700 domain-containing protein [Lachnospiraceae bacterium]